MRNLSRIARRAHRPIVRWWWPRADVNSSQLWEEIVEFAKLGFGGVEVQAFSLGLSESNSVHKVGSAHYQRMLRYSQACCTKLGMTFHCTCSSGWPLSVLNPRHQEQEVVSASRPVPHYQPLLQNKFDLYDVSRPARKAHLSPFAILQDTRRVAIGNALSQTAFVADHLSASAAKEVASCIHKYIVPFRITGDLFLDSFELVGHLPYTDSFSSSFRRRYGYDIVPLLHHVIQTDGDNKYYEMLKSGVQEGLTNPLAYAPLMMRSSTSFPSRREVMAAIPTAEFEDERRGVSKRVRRDYEEHRSLLFQLFLRVLLTNLRRQGQTVRLQAHGGFSHCIDAYSLADVAETETLFAGGSVEFMRMASSASDLNGKKSSCECLIMIGDAPKPNERFRLIKRTFAAGVERIVFHGAAYRRRSEEGGTDQDWYPFAPTSTIPVPLTTNLRNIDQSAVKEMTRLCFHLSKLMHVGRPVSDILWIVESDAYPDRVCISSEQCRPHAGETKTGKHLRLAGITYLMTSIRLFSRLRVGDGRAQTLHDSFETILVSESLSSHPSVSRARKHGVTVCVRAEDVQSVSPMFPFCRGFHTRGKEMHTGVYRVLLYNDSDRALPLNLDLLETTRKSGDRCTCIRSKVKFRSNNETRLAIASHVSPTELVVVDVETRVSPFT